MSKPRTVSLPTLTRLLPYPWLPSAVSEVAAGQGVWVVWAEHPQLVGEQLGVGGGGAGRVPGLPTPVGEVAAGGQGVGVVWAEHPQLVGEQLGVGGGGAGRVPGFPQPGGEVAAGGQGVGVVSPNGLGEREQSSRLRLRPKPAAHAVVGET